MFNLENKDGTGNAIEGIVSVLVVGVIFAPLVLLGLFYPKWWAMALAGAIGGAVSAKVVTKGSWKNVIGWGVVGFLAGLVFGLFGE